MTERLSDVEARIHTVHQLSAVITAMRGIAAARTREARTQLDGVRAYAGTIATAIGHALAFLPAAERLGPPPQAPGTHVIIALCAEQGFAGSFNEHVFDAVQRVQNEQPCPQTELLVVGDRGLMIADQRGLTVNWSVPMVAHPAQVAKLANRIVEALYARLDEERVVRVTLLHKTPDMSEVLPVVERRLVPFDFSRFPLPQGARAPLITLSPQALLAKLVEEYIFAELCEAVTLSFAAENEARMRAMIAARSNVEKTLDGLVIRSRQLRQEEITNEVVELATGIEQDTSAVH